MENEDNGTGGDVKTLTPEEIQAQVNALVTEQLRDIKLKLDSAYTSRDEAIRKTAQLEEASKTKDMEALTAAGKHQEVLEMKLTSLKEKLELAEKRNVQYERNAVVKESLSGLKFRNARSAEMAEKDIIEQLVQNQDGTWVHKTGVAIKDFVANFSKDEDNSFLFEVKQNSGSGGQGANGTPNMTTKKSVKDMNTQEIMAAAAAGQLGSFNY